MSNQANNQGILDSTDYEDKMSEAALLARLQEKSRDKSYQEENRWWYSLTNITSYLCQLINIFSGFAKPYAYLIGIFSFGFVGDILAVVVSAFIVVAIEFAGRKNMEQFFEKKFFKGKVMNGRIFAQVMLMGGIISLSYLGAPDAARIMSGDVAAPTPLLLNESDVRDHYTPLIAASELQEKEFFSASSYLGKLAPINQRRYNEKQNTTSALRAEMSAKIAEVGKMNRDATEATKQEFAALKAKKEAEDAKNGTIFAFIAVISCFLFLVMVWLKEKYEYLSAVELLKKGALKNEGMTARLKHTLATISSDEVRADVEAGTLPHAEVRRPIGFVLPGTHTPPPTPTAGVTHHAVGVSHQHRDSDAVLKVARQDSSRWFGNFGELEDGGNGKHNPATVSGHINAIIDGLRNTLKQPHFQPSRDASVRTYAHFAQLIPRLEEKGWPYPTGLIFIDELRKVIPEQEA